MSTTAPRAEAMRRAVSSPAWAERPPGRARRGRSRSRIVAAVALLIVGAWIAAAAFLSVGSRREVLVVAHPVPRYAKLTRADLKIVRVASDGGLSFIAANRINATVGRVTAVDLTADTPLADAELLKSGTRPVRDGEAVVGALLSPADSPDPLPRGASVKVVVRPAQATTGDARSISGWILRVESAGATGEGGHRVSLVVPAAEADLVSSAAADGRVTVVVLGGS